MNSRSLAGPICLWLICLWLICCGRVTAQPGDALEIIPEPQLSALEEAVADQLRLARRLTLEQAEDESLPPEERASGLGELGILYQAYELDAAAWVCHRNAERLDPNDPRWPYYLGHLHRRSGRFEAAEAAFRRSLARSGGELAPIFYLGNVLLALDRPDEAVEMLQTGLRRYPSSASLLAMLGQSQLAQRDYQAAVRSLEAALAAVPAATRLNHPLAMAYRGMGEVEKAREMLSRRGEVGLRPPDPLLDALENGQVGERVHLLRGRAAYRAGSYSAAAAAFRQAVDAAPNSARARVNLGVVLAQQGETTAAIRFLREALALDPGNSTARFNLAMLLARRDGSQEAVELLRTIVTANEDDLEAQLELGALLQRRGNSQAAQSHYERALATHPRDSRARLGYASTLVDLRRIAEALAALERGLELDPAAGLIAHALAKMLAASPTIEQRDGTRALSLARRVFEAQPTPSHIETVALALAELGRCEEAAQWQQRAIEGLEASQVEHRQRLEEGLGHYLNSGVECRPPGQKFLD